jgi:hypothetical protein
MIIQYYLKAETSAKPTIAISDSKGKEVARLTGAGKPGINSVRWTTRDRGDEAGRGRGGRGGAGGAGEGGSGRQAGPGVNVLDQWAPLGEYTVALDVGGKKHTRKAQITKMQGWSIGATPQIIKSTGGRGSS